MVFMLNAQDITVTGRISDAEEGEYLPGVTIVEKGTTNGTVTDIDGNYAIKVPQGAILVFSFVGYAKQEIVADKIMVNVQLSPEAMMLEETVVIGYGTQRKREVTGSIAKVSGKELTEIPVPSFEAGLQGKAAGVQIIQSNGMAGAGSAVRVRGPGSISAGGDPLYVVDGIPVVQNESIEGTATGTQITSERVGGINTNPLDFINPNDILFRMSPLKEQPQVPRSHPKGLVVSIPIPSILLIPTTSSPLKSLKMPLQLLFTAPGVPMV